MGAKWHILALLFTVLVFGAYGQGETMPGAAALESANELYAEPGLEVEGQAAPEAEFAPGDETAEEDVPEEAPARPENRAGLDEVNALYNAGAEPAEGDEEPARRERARAEGFSPYVQGLAALCILCGAIIFLGWLVRKVGVRTPLMAGQRYGQVIGRVPLTPRASLHYVRTADRVLVVGVTPNEVRLVSEFPADAFDGETGGRGEESGAAPDFMSHLRSASAAPAAAEDEDMSVLRGDLARLQHYLREHGGRDDV